MARSVLINHSESADREDRFQFETIGCGVATHHSRESLDPWRQVLVESVRRGGPDLSQRQLALLLTVYLTPPPHTVRGLAGLLRVSKPAISRALDRLGMLDFARRKRDDSDRRNVLVQRTVKGAVFLHDFEALIARAARDQ